MTTPDGWMHDKYNIKMMLLTETVLGLGLVVIVVFILSKTKLANQNNQLSGDFSSWKNYTC
jgi:hypothetical protein